MKKRNKQNPNQKNWSRMPNKIFLKLIDKSPVGVSQPWNLTSCFIWVIGRMNPWGLTNPNGRQLRRSFLLQGMTERI